MPRAARLDACLCVSARRQAPGTLHHVIVRGIERRHIIDDNEDRKEFVKRMGHLAVDTKTVIYAWALLNDHAHILLRSSEYGLSKRIDFGQPAAAYNQRSIQASGQAGRGAWHFLGGNGASTGRIHFSHLQDHAEV